MTMTVTMTNARSHANEDPMQKNIYQQLQQQHQASIQKSFPTCFLMVSERDYGHLGPTNVCVCLPALAVRCADGSIAGSGSFWLCKAHRLVACFAIFFLRFSYIIYISLFIYARCPFLSELLTLTLPTAV